MNVGRISFMDQGIENLRAGLVANQANEYQLRWLRVILWVNILVLSLLWGWAWLTAVSSVTTWIIFAFLLAGMVAQGLVYRQRLHAAVLLLVLGCYLGLTLNLYWSTQFWVLSVLGNWGLITLGYLFGTHRLAGGFTAVVVLTPPLIWLLPGSALTAVPLSLLLLLGALTIGHAALLYWLSCDMRTSSAQAHSTSRELVYHKRLLEDINTRLEKRVAERTAALAETNDKLLDSVEEYQAAMKELRLLESALKHTGDAVVLIKRHDSGELFLQYANSAVTNLFGYAPEAVLGQSPRILFDPLPPEFETDDIPTAAVSREMTIERKNGSELWVEMTLTAVLTSIPGKYWVAVLRDISQRKQVEQQLRLMESVATKTHNGVIILDTADPHPQIAYVNDGFQKLTGYALNTAVGQTLNWLYGPTTAPDTIYSVTEALRHAQPLTAELAIYRHDQTPVWCTLNLTPVHDDTDTLSHWVAIMTDISNRKELDEQLLLLNAVVANATEGVIITKVTPDDSVITYVNQAFAHITGQEIDDMIGHNVQELIATYADPDTIKAWMNSYDQHHNNMLETRLVRADGSTFWGQLMMWPIYQQTEATALEPVEYWVTMIRDVTAAHEMEEKFNQAQKLEAIGRLAGGVAHDFNNLLTILLSYSDHLLYMDDMPEAAESYLKAMYKASKQAANLTRQLLAFSRRQVTRLERLQLNDLMRDMERMISRLIGEDINIQLQLDPDLHPITADAGQLQQILMNLAVNARDAMPNGGTLTVQTANVTLYEQSKTPLSLPPGDYITWSIRDSGEGMSDETIARIFEPFFTTKAVDKGTGLGLSTVYGIVQQSGGDIRVSSELDKGTVFTIFLPRAHAGDVDGEAWPLLPEEMAEDNRATAVAPRRTILVVEDEEEVRVIIASILDSHGYNVLVATDGDDAWQLYQQHTDKIDLLLTDVVMPHLSGPELVNQIKATGRHLPVLYMTGYPQDFITTYGPVDQQHILNKPFTSADLLVSVQQHVASRT